MNAQTEKRPEPAIKKNETTTDRICTPSIIISTKDKAGMNIKSKLESLHGFAKNGELCFKHPVLEKKTENGPVKLYTTDKETIHCEGIDLDIDGDAIIFATRHKSAAGKKAFSVHVPGNWDGADAGGKEKTLCAALPRLMKKALLLIREKYHGDEFSIIQECTHHGPSLSKPCMFIEIGSSEQEWERNDAGEIIAAVLSEITGSSLPDENNGKNILLIGGGHYSQAGTKIMLNTEFAVGHICPKHKLESFDEKLLKSAVEKTPGFFIAALDWKGLGKEKQKIVNLLEKSGIRYERYKRLQEIV